MPLLLCPPANVRPRHRWSPAPAAWEEHLEANQKTLRNAVLSGLSLPDFARLRRHLEDVELPVRKMLEARQRRIEYAYFLESGMASVLVTAGSQHTVEVGMIGHEGMTGMALVMATDRSPHETFMQGAGTAWRIAAANLLGAMEDSKTLRPHLLRHAQAFQVQMSFTALANARYRLEERLARWLLMAQDRMDSPEFALTHEFLSLMLGVRRPGVTTALNVFEQNGLIRSQRGFISILKRAALEDAANGCYGGPEAEAERLFGKT
jgi:CRP-like cAMP-binding protein